MEESFDGMEIMVLFLRKFEQFNEKEREVLISAIELMNRPIFIAKN